MFLALNERVLADLAFLGKLNTEREYSVSRRLRLGAGGSGDSARLYTVALDAHQCRR
jgi:hypothetical protein